MKKFASSLVAVALLCQMISCSLNPSWILNPEATDYDKKRGKILDTTKTRDFMLSNYSNFLDRELAGEVNDWNDGWKRIFEALDQNNDNPAFYKNWVIEERRKRGLPELRL